LLVYFTVRDIDVTSAQHDLPSLYVKAKCADVCHSSDIMESYFSTWNYSWFSIFFLPSQSAEN